MANMSVQVTNPIQRRNNVQVCGDGPATMVLVHGFGCDQNIWRLMAPAFQTRFRIVLVDLVGSGNSDLSAYDREKYDSLQGHADDMLEVIEEFAVGPVIFVGHSVSAMIGVLAGLKAPEKFAALVLIGPSPCYLNDADYIGGFTQQDIESLLETLESNYLGWSSKMAPVIMGAPEQPELAQELTNSFCRTDPEIAQHFARVTFLSDHRAELARLDLPTLILQCSDDLIAPLSVGEYVHRTLARSTLRIIDNIGHCPHLSQPSASTSAIEEFLRVSVADVLPTGSKPALTADALYEHAPCGLLVTGPEGTIRRVNATFCGWTGYEPEALVGHRKLQDLLNMGGRIFHQTQWAPLLQMQGSVAEVKLDITHRDGHAIPMVMNATSRSSGGQLCHEIALFVAQDRHKYEYELLLARKRAEELVEKEQQAQQLLLLAQVDVSRQHVRDMAARLRQEQEMSLLNEQLDERVKQRTELLEKANVELRGFAHSLAHDLRGPITTIGGFSGKLEKMLGDAGDERIKHLARRIRLAATQMVDYTDALLTLAGLSQAELLVTDVDLSALARSVLANLQEGNAQRVVRLTVQENLHVRGDARLLRLMIDHLLDNAWKFTSPREVAEISFTADENVQGEMCFCVKDNGVGFNPSYADKLFGSFQRLHSPAEFPGMGVGLANVARVVSRHEGRIWAESAEGQGAAFFFTFGARRVPMED